MSLAEKQAKKIGDAVLARVAKAARGAEAMVSITHEQKGNTRFAVNEITSSSDVETVDLSVTVKVGLRAATSTTNQLDGAALDAVVERATRMARIAPENPEAMPVLGRQSYLPARNGSDEATRGAGAAIRARAAGTAIKRATGAKVTIAGFYEHGDQSRSLASSAGLWAHHALTTCEYTCSARTADGTGSGWAGADSNRVADLDADSLSAVAIDKAVRSAKPRRLEPGKYTVVIEPSGVSALLSFLIEALDARDADEGRSFFSKAGGGNRVGDKLFPDTITLSSDPTDASLSIHPFDDDGTPLMTRRWIDRGKLTGLSYARYWAKKQGHAATGFPAGWSLEGGKASRDELIKGVKRGILITRLWYLREVDPQSLLATGLTRDGTFLIENGVVTAPVNNFRFNESPVTMLANCDGLTSSVIVGSADGPVMRVPTLRTREFNLSSISEAV